MGLFQRHTGLLRSKVDKNTVLFQYHTNFKDSSPVVFRVSFRTGTPSLTPNKISTPAHNPRIQNRKVSLDYMCLGQRPVGSRALLNMASSLL